MEKNLVKLYIEPTSNCNFHCSMCFRHSWFDEEFCDIPYELFQKGIDTMPKTVKTVFFGGMGEPLFHPDIVKMVDYAAIKAKVELLTNASLLTEEMSEELIKANLSMLWISVDHISSSKGNKTGHHNSLVKLEAILQGFNQKRQLHNRRLKLGLTFVAMKSNLHELNELAAFAYKHHINDINISNSYTSDEASEAETLFGNTLDNEVGADWQSPVKINIDLPYMDFSEPETCAILCRLASSPFFNTSISGTPLTRQTKYCRFIEEGISFIRSDGDISPCMALLHNGYTSWKKDSRKVYHKSFGNIKDSNLTDVWNSQKYLAFRETVHKFDFSPCLHCGHCDYFSENVEDCFGNEQPTCGGCLWAEGLISCP